MTKSKNTATIVDMPSKEQLEMATRPYSDAELNVSPAVKAKIDKLMEFFDQYGIGYDKFKPEFVSFLPEKKEAYPNFDQYQYIAGEHNTQKWLHAVRDIYKKEQVGKGRVNSIRQVTSGWNIMETHDFLNWLRFYEGNNHLKYKKAQLWYENGAPGYFLPIKPDPATENTSKVDGNAIDFAKQEAVQDEEKRQLIEKQRAKIVGRLDSAEKLLRSLDGQTFAGPEFEALMEAIYQLKRKIHMVNKLSSSTRLYEDMIVRQANVLASQGYVQAADLLYKTSQANNPPPPGIGTKKDTPLTAPAPDSPIAPMSPGAPGGLPSMGPGMSQNAPASTGVPEVGPNENSPTNLQGVTKQPSNDTPASGPASPIPQGNGDITSPALVNFLDNLNNGKNTGDDKAVADDTLEVHDNFEVQEVQDELMITEAQAMLPIDEPMTTSPAPAPLNPGPPAPKLPDAPKSPKMPEAPAAEELEVTEDDLKPESEDLTESTSNFDEQIDNTFKNVTISDVVSKLGIISTYYKTREHPRQLQMVDMMLDSLGLAALFPSLSEALNKSLEANNYISTRVDDILSKLRGAMVSQKKGLTKLENEGKPEISDIKSKLQEDADQEKARKQQRKEQENADLSGKGKEKPEVEIEEDLAPKGPAFPPSVPAIAPAKGPAPVPPPLG